MALATVDLVYSTFTFCNKPKKLSLVRNLKLKFFNIKNI